jgi:hypothetical protein
MGDVCDNAVCGPCKRCVEAMAAFDAVGHGDRAAYERAIDGARRHVHDPILQLAMVDCVLAARVRAYGDKRAPQYRRGST